MTGKPAINFEWFFYRFHRFRYLTNVSASNSSGKIKFGLFRILIWHHDPDHKMTLLTYSIPLRHLSFCVILSEVNLQG